MRPEIDETDPVAPDLLEQELEAWRRFMRTLLVCTICGIEVVK